MGREKQRKGERGRERIKKRRGRERKREREGVKVTTR